MPREGRPALYVCHVSIRAALVSAPPSLPHTCARPAPPTTVRLPGPGWLQLLRPPLFTSAGALKSAVQDAVALLRVPRSSLGITAAGRGAVAGLVSLQEGPTAPWQDCSTVGEAQGRTGSQAHASMQQRLAPALPGLALAFAPPAAGCSHGWMPAGPACIHPCMHVHAGAAGRALPGDLVALARWRSACSARYLLVVEKDAIFQRLAADRIWDKGEARGTKGEARVRACAGTGPWPMGLCRWPMRRMAVGRWNGGQGRAGDPSAPGLAAPGVMVMTVYSESALSGQRALPARMHACQPPNLPAAACRCRGPCHAVQCRA